VEDQDTVTLYETLFVVHPEKGARMKEFIDRFKKVIEGQEGTVAHVDEWGVRDLARLLHVAALPGHGARRR
jgi:ribosomal protein S6